MGRAEKLNKDRRFRFAVGYVIEQEGTKPVERLVRDGTRSRFGVRQSWVPGTKLEDLTREDAEEILKTRQWQFYDYDKVEKSLTIPTKIFDTHIVFSPFVAIEKAESALQAVGQNLSETKTLDYTTRRAIEEVGLQDFFPVYADMLEDYVESKYEGREALLKRVRRRPYRNVDASSTSI